MAAKATRDPFGPFTNGFTYEQAFNGNTWIIKKGEDFDLASSTMRQKIRDEFDRRFGKLDCEIDGDSVFVRFVAPVQR